MRFSVQSLRRVVSALRRRWSAPPRSVLADTKSVAFITTNRADRQAKRWSEEATKFGAEVDVMPTVQPYRRSDGRIMSILAPPPREAYDRIIVGASVDLFDHSWTYAFLDRLNSLLAERGTILVQPQLISKERLTELFGHAPRSAPQGLLEFAKAQGRIRRPKDAAHSTLDAYWPLREALLHGAFDEGLATTIHALGVERVEKRKPERRDPLELEQSQCYRTTSACTKAAMVRWLAELHFPERRDLHLADLGCGTGLNTLELMLSPSHIAKLTLVEPHRVYHWDIAAIYARIEEHLLGPVSLVGEKVQTYRGGGADIGLFCAVLSVMPREEREAFAAGAWENVAPGGILVALENMHRDVPVKTDRYNEERYTPDEIDAVLGRFGPIRYFQNDAMAELSRAEAGNRTVFRVIRKPGL